MALLAKFIGIDRHSDPKIRDLNGATRDAKALWALFSDSVPDDLGASLLVDSAATLGGVRAALDDTLGRATSDDVVLLSFAGHGTPDHRLVMTDSRLDDVAATTIPMGELAQRFRQSQARAIILLLDCCFSGGAPARVIEDLPIPRDPGTPLEAVAGNGRLLFAASGVAEPALEDPENRHGLFTHAVIEGLLGKEQPVSAVALVDQVVRSVRANAARFGLVQTPVMFGHVEGYANGKYIRDADYASPKLGRHSVDHTWTTTRDMPSGRLRLIAYCPYHRVKWSKIWQETKKSALSGQISEIVKTIENSAEEIVAKLGEAERQAELERQRWNEQREKYLKDEDQRQIEKSIGDSKDHLRQIIQRWSNIVDVEKFLAGVEARSAELPAAEQDQVSQRLKLAREFLGNVDPLQFFLGWKTPTERHQPQYEADHEPPAQA